MLKANVGSSVLKCAKSAGKEAALAAAAGLESVGAVFVYGSCGYDIADMMAGVEEALPGVPAFGNTSFTGIITPEGFVSSDDGFIGVMALSDPEMKIGAAASERGADPFETGRNVAVAAMEAAGMDTAPNFFYMAASPAEEEFYLKGISSVIGRVPFFGGSAADNSISGDWKLYCGDKNFADGAVAVFFYGDIKITNVFTGAYRETEDFGVITKVSGNRTLVEIDGEPATEKFAKWLGCEKEAVTGGNLLVTCVLSPLGVKDRLGDLTAIRHPMNGNEDGSMAVGNNLAEKTCVIRMEATVDELISSVSETMRELKTKAGAKPLAYHLVHCGGRRAGIGDRIGEVADALKKEADGVPFIVEFTFGEYGFESDNNNTCGGLMLSFTAFTN
ncbi:MAG: FIST N-terminal domain-containing protein [Synergistaceae bacterium]